MQILLSGANGFLGDLVKGSLASSERIVTVGRKNADIVADFSTEVPSIRQKYDLVIHAAGKAHSVPKTTSEKQAFFDVNVTGTKNLLKGIQKAPQLPRYFVFISSVSVYGLDKGILIKEDATLLAQDPYGKSKIEAEKTVQDWCQKNDVICTVLRLPLIAGPNPPGNLGAMIRGISRGYYFNIGKGEARKSIVLAEDVAKIIPQVAKIGGTYNLTDRYHPSFFELSENIAKQLNHSQPASIPMLIAKIMAGIGNMLGSKAPINSRKLTKIVSELTFDDSKAVEAFGWNPTPVLQGFKIR